MCFPGLVLSVLGCRIGLEDRECNRSSSWVGAVSIVFLEISEGDGGAEKVVDGLLRPVLMYFRNGAAFHFHHGSALERVMSSTSRQGRQNDERVVGRALR